MEIHDDELYHWGIFGMKWGVRRYQNPDGTLTPEGRKRYRKSAKEMSDEELVSAINRLANEKRYTDLVKSMEPEPRNRTEQFLANVRKVAKTAQPVLAPFGKAYTYGMEKALTKTMDKYFTSEEEREMKKIEKEFLKVTTETKLKDLKESNEQHDKFWHLIDERDKAKILSELASYQATAAEKQEALRRGGMNKRDDGTAPYYDYLNKSGGKPSLDSALDKLADEYGLSKDDIKKMLGRS